ncbi:MAG: PLP-dependent aspartate aminotransferase family protein [Aureliella sp.]
MSDSREPNGQYEREAAALHNESTAATSGQAIALDFSSVWPMESTMQADGALAGQNDSFVYRRDGHPGDRELTAKLAMLHGGEAAVLTAQGMSAIAAICLAELSPGAKVWIADELYGRTQRLMLGDMKKWGVEVVEFSATDSTALDRLAADQCALVVVETISNPRLGVTDIRRVVAAAKKAGAKTVVDNTFATHAICRPLQLGADFVVESLGKIVCGHSDSMLGLVACGCKADADSLATTISTFGMASNPMDCYMTHRGLLSMAVRIDRSCDNSAKLASALGAVSAVANVDYPGLPNHPQHALATEQLGGRFGWMLTIELHPEFGDADKLFQSLAPEILFVPSLGDVATTVSHPFSTSHRSMPAQQREQLGISPRTVRISCGLEPTDWLVERFTRALDS